MNPTAHTCPDCGATIQAGDMASPVRCWLCAYSMGIQELTQAPPQPKSKYERLFESTYYLMGGFLILTALGQIYLAMTAGPNAEEEWFSAILYCIFVAVVFVAANVRTSKKAKAGQPIGFRERAGSLLASFVVTIAIGALVLVGIAFALFVACLAAVSTGGL